MPKLVLVVNCGSSSLKFAIIDPHSGEAHLSGLAESLGLAEARIQWLYNGHKKESELEPAADHEQALTFIVTRLLSLHPELQDNLLAIGHRVVHGGETFTQSVLIDEQVIDGIRACIPLAPLHNPAHLMGITAAQHTFPELPNVAVFDTAFHQTLPEAAYLYALPYTLYQEQGIRRYGMHGSSHYFITQQLAKRLGKPVEELNFINCHLGNGASVCAVKNGQSVDTSMGLTPLEGLVMGTRSGDIDPAIIFHLHDALGYSLSQINDLLTKQSGLLGLTGTSSDFRFIEERLAQKSERAERAFGVFCHRLVKYIGAYAMLMDGRLDAVCFTGGIGENSIEVRARVIRQLGLLGLQLDEEKNRQACRGQEGCITTADSQVSGWVLSTNEELVIARDTARIAGLSI